MSPAGVMPSVDRERADASDAEGAIGAVVVAMGYGTG
jgi:hypothetical protein